MYLKIPKQFAAEIAIQQHIRSLSLVERIIYYMIDWKYRKSVNLQKWLANALTYNNPVIPDTGILLTDSNRIKCQKALKYVHSITTYLGDPEQWDTEEKWQTPLETWTSHLGDCEDGAILLYAILTNHGVPDDQLRIVAGDVVGGGHAYVVWLSDEDGLEYALDWCYWYNRSINMNNPYVLEVNYNYGQLEWFSFNKATAYRRKQQ